MLLLQELKRRNVIRVGMAYLAGAWLIVQVVDTVIPWLGLSDAVGRILLIVLIVGFVPAVIVAWLLEWTSDGIRFEDEVEVDAAGAVVARRRLDRVIIGILALAVVYFAVDKFLFDVSQADSYYGDRSVAVLPFTATVADPEQEFVAAGISSEVNDLLAQLRNLRVISTRSVLAVVEQDLGVIEMGDRLEVGHLLEGTVQRYGDTVRVTAQLIDARSDRQLWSETYERNTDDVFGLQDELAAAVAEALQIKLLGPPPKSRVTDPRVRELTLQAKQLSERRPTDFGLKMKSLLDEALAIDPDYVPALEWMLTANIHMRQAGVLPPDEQERLDEDIKRRIRTLDPDNAWVLALDAWEAAYGEREFERAAALFARAVATDPSDSNGVRIAAVFARSIGRFDQSVRLLRHAVAIDPLCYQCIYQLSRTYMYMGRYEKALRERERFLALGSGGHLHHALTLQLQGKPGEALAYLESLDWDSASNNQLIAAIAMAEFDVGRIADAEEKLARLITAADEFFGFKRVAGVAAWMGKKDIAFEYLDRVRGYFEGADWEDIFNSEYVATITAPEFIRLHGDPRWIGLRNATGMSAQRFDAIQFNPELPDELPYDRIE
jgi:TolB-like protein/tetratricopeptide (TPR) repeat protein